MISGISHPSGAVMLSGNRSITVAALIAASNRDSNGAVAGIAEVYD